MSIIDMAKSHLNSVQKAIIDLENQKKNIEQEIEKLSVYLQEGLKEIQENTSNVEVVTAKDE